MALETVTYISDLVATNPASGDTLNQTDDHLRIIKSGLKTTFPNVTGAVTATHSDLNRILTSMTAQSASGTAIDFTSIPSWVKRITVIFSGVSTSGTSQPLIQIGDSGGIEFAGYSGSSTGSAPSNVVTGQPSTTGFGLKSELPSDAVHGHMVIANITGTGWVASGAFAYSNSAATIVTGGTKSLTGTLDRVRITTANGTDTLDGGTVTVLYE
jgi:hypothetical protein